MALRRLSSTTMFGTLSSIDVIEGSLSFLLIIATVILFEQVVERLSDKTKFTPWETIIVSIKNELMVVGGMAFILKCVLYSIEVNEHWLHAIEFADLVVPITAFFFVFQGLFYILFAIWEGDHLLHVYRQDSTVSKIYPSKTFLELRYAKLVFCEKHIVGVIRIEVSIWIMIILFIFLNWARVELNIVSSEDVCGTDDEYCKNFNDIQVFTVVGCGIFFAVLVLALVTRHYAFKVLVEHDESTRGQGQDTHALLKEVLQSRKEQQEVEASDPLDDLKSHLRRSVHVDEEQALQLMHVEERPSPWKQVIDPLSQLLRKIGVLEEEDPGFYSEKMKSNFLFNSPDLYFSFIDHILMLISFYMSLWVVNFSYSTAPFPQPNRSDWIVGSLAPGVASGLLFIYVVRTSFIIKAVAFHDDVIIADMIEEKEQLKLNRDLIKQAIFLQLLKDEMYFRAMDVPARCDFIKNKLTVRDGRQKLQKFFHDIDTDHSGTLSKKEFKHALQHRFHIVLTRKMWHAFFAAIDTDGSHSIDFEELCQFLL